MNFVVIVASMTAFWHTSSAGPDERQGKFLGISSDDMMSDIFDEIYDPFPRPANSISVRDYVLKKINKKTDDTDYNKIPPFPIPQQIVQKLAPTSPPPRTTIQPPVMSTTEESLILYDSGNSKFEITPAGFASHPQPITEGMFLIGGQFGQSEKPPNITVNVPDFMKVMAQFFSERLPFWANNQDGNPTPPYRTTPPIQSAGELNLEDLPGETNFLEYRRMSPPATQKPKRKMTKGNKKNNKRRKASESSSPTNRKPLRKTNLPSVLPEVKLHSFAGIRPVRVPQQEKFQTPEVVGKSWFQRSTEPTADRQKQESKLIDYNNSPNASVIKYKNQAIEKRNNEWKEKTFFNFRDSTLKDSSMMMVNVPKRNVVMYSYKTGTQ